MEANFFRALAREVETIASGRRIEKIFAPTDGTWTFRLDSHHALRFLIYRPAKSAGLFFFTDQKPVNPMQPPARVMWYRKRVAGRRILAQHTDWPSLRLAWELTPKSAPGHGRFLIFSLRGDLALADELPAAFGAEATWPALDQVLDQSREAWREHPHLSPPLRRALAARSDDDAASLYATLMSGSTGQYCLHKGGFPLPWRSSEKDEQFGSALEAATVHGEQTLFPLLERDDFSPQRARLKRERKKIRRALARLDQEKQVLDQRRVLKVQAEAMQAEMYRLKDLDESDEAETLHLKHPEHGPLEIRLDPKLDLVENMERLFKLAAKAERGYVHLARRKNELGKEMARLEAESAALAKGAPAHRHDEPKASSTEQQGPPPLPKRYRGMAVSLFTSSDGMLILRGKNKKANHEILSKAASPFDWWFHAAHGPSSHVILKRDHPGQEVPEQTLLEAAGLCALKSHYRDAGKADIMFALVKDVRKVKGWDHGRVAVDQVLGTVRVDIEDGLEKKLARS